MQVSSYADLKTDYPDHKHRKIQNLVKDTIPVISLDKSKRATDSAYLRNATHTGLGKGKLYDRQGDGPQESSFSRTMENFYR